METTRIHPQNTTVPTPPEQVRETAAPTRNVLLAADLEALSPPALLRAHAMTRLFGGHLHVLRVVPAFRGVNALFPNQNQQQSLAHVQLAARMHSDTEEACRRVLGDAEVSVQVRHGSFAKTVTAVARELRAELIVVPHQHTHSGRELTALARACETAVLAAAEPQTRGIVAGTDLADPQYPVLARGVELARRLDAPLTAVHNAEPFVPAALASPGNPAVVVDARRVDDAARASAWRRMRDLMRSFAVDIDPVVVSRFGTADAILDVARSADADLVLVGTRHRPWWMRLLGNSVAANVVDRAQRSVLVVPMSTSTAAAA